MSQQLLTMNDIAQLIDMPYGRLVKVLHRIEGFPKPVDKKGLYRVYERAAVEAFNQQYNLADTVNDCFIQYYQERYSIQKAKAEKKQLEKIKNHPNRNKRFIKYALKVTIITNLISLLFF